MRIVTWNTWWQFGDWKSRQPLLADALSAQQADLVLLQETWPAQAAALAEACGLDVLACAAGPYQLDGWNQPADDPFGNAVLGRPGPVEPAGRLALESPSDAAQRVALAVTVDRGPDRAPLLVVSTHLHHRSAMGAARRAQLDAIREWVDELHPDGPVVLGGDLNQTPYSEEYRLALAPHWLDLWTVARPDDPGSTMVPDNVNIELASWMEHRNGPGRPPGVRFDYLLARRGRLGRATPTVSAMHLIGGADHGWPSDHLGIVADLDLDLDLDLDRV